MRRANVNLYVLQTLFYFPILFHRYIKLSYEIVRLISLLVCNNCTPLIQVCILLPRFLRRSNCLSCCMNWMQGSSRCPDSKVFPSAIALCSPSVSGGRCYVMLAELDCLNYTQMTHSQPISLTFTLILSHIVRGGLPTGLLH
jgi:hypothetical protein